MANRLIAIQDHGQSIWYDNIRRGLITSGELAAMIAGDGVVGVTSNPAIFTAAITGSPDYDATLKTLVDQRVGTAMQIYERLAIEDIRMAADVLHPVYERTRRVDGYVSLEVSPYLAHDTQATIAEARRLFAAVGRPNVMIKVPGTPAGIPAIETLIGDGININVTLLFAIDRYEQVAAAFMSGLEKRAAAGGDVAAVASVASFFVSRVDTLVDDRIAGPGQLLDKTTDPAARDKLKSLVGKVAIANAKLAYARYRELYATDRWRSLAARGAMPQRLLWASTSTKNAKYPKTLYVDELIGPQTVNTLPAETVVAFRESGSVRPSLTENWDANIAAARRIIDTLAEVGISMAEVTDALLQDAVKKFSDPFDKLLASIEKKRQSMQGGLATQTAALGAHAEAVQKTLDDWRSSGKVRRLWAADKSLWSGDDEDQWLGWLHIVESQQECGSQFAQLAADVRSAGFAHVVLLGMGGSSLAPEVWNKTFGRVTGFPTLHVLDSTVPEQVRSVERRVELSRTLFVVSSKSGGTIETNVLKQYFMDRVCAAVGPDAAGAHFLAITDPKTKLHASAKAERFRHICHGLATIGGRFSALSNFGLAPLALMGGDVASMLDRAEVMVQACASCVPPELNPGVALGAILGTLARQGRDKLTIVASPAIAGLGAWLEQLVAESTGKAHPTTRAGVGIVPVDGERLAPSAAYGPDRLFVYERLGADSDAGQDAAIDAIEQAGHPVVRINLASTLDLGQEMFRWEIATAVAGAILGINPFNQPDVEAAKVAARSLMAQFAETGSLPPQTPVASDADLALFADAANADALLTRVGGDRAIDGLLRAHLDRVRPGDYFAVNAYVEMNEANESPLQSLRHAVRDSKRVATTLGYGPRFLHSTGQLHKGGPNTGVFLQITADEAEPLPVPGERFSFGVLKQAQAQGDFRVLADRGRRVLWVHLRGDVQGGLGALADRVARIVL